MQPLSPDLARAYEGLHNSKMLEKRASVTSPADSLKALQEKAQNDYNTFELVKQAGLADLAKNPIVRGAGYAAGAAVPAVIAGNMISNHAAEQGRNKALEAGAGLAAIGGTMYGIHRMMQPKTASDAAIEEKDVQEALQKLASVGYIDEMLDVAMSDKTASAEARKLAVEVKYLNREFGCEILRNLVG